MERNSQQPLELFYCYARKDRALRNELDIHLTGLRRSGLVTTWYDGEIVPGADWEQEIASHLNTADIILLLVSPHFIQSDYCYSKEMKRAMERHHQRETRVVPILLRPVDWADTPFRHIQVLPTDALPITRWQDRDEAFEDVARGVRRVVNELFPQLITAPDPPVPANEVALPASLPDIPPQSTIRSPEKPLWSIPLPQTGDAPSLNSPPPPDTSPSHGGKTSRELLTPKSKQRTSSIIAMMGAKGGVGKSTITCRMAEMIAETSHTVAILDLDTGTAGSTTLLRNRGFDISNALSVYEILTHLAEKSELPVDISSLADVTPKYLLERETVGKVFLMPAAPLDRERKAQTIQLIRQIDPDLDPVTMGRVLDTLLARMELDNTMIDSIIIDCGAEGVEFNPLVAEAYTRSAVTYIVVQPDPVSRENIHHVTRLLPPHAQTEKLRVIINRVYSLQHEPVARAQFSAYEVAGCIPDDPMLFKDMQRGRVNHRYGYDEISRTVREVLEHDLPASMIPDEADLWIRPATRAIIELNLPGYFRKEILRPLIIRWAVCTSVSLALLASSGWPFFALIFVENNTPLVPKILIGVVFVSGVLLLIGMVIHFLFWLERVRLVRRLQKMNVTSANAQRDIESYLLALNAIESNFELLEWLRNLIATQRQPLQLRRE